MESQGQERINNAWVGGQNESTAGNRREECDQEQNYEENEEISIDL